jgi:hypothetical protein
MISYNLMVVDFLTSLEHVAEAVGYAIVWLTVLLDPVVARSAAVTSTILMLKHSVKPIQRLAT